jgi:hypothetical protein
MTRRQAYPTAMRKTAESTRLFPFQERAPREIVDELAGGASGSA